MKTLLLTLCLTLCFLVLPFAQATAEDALAEIHRLQAMDQPYDGQSIYWDGNKAALVKDELDSKTILDGRGGPYRIDSYTVLGGITVYTPVWPAYILEDTENAYTAADAQWYVHVKRGGEEQTPVPYERIVDLDSFRYFAITHVITQGDATYTFTLGHIGNLSDLYVMASFFFGDIAIP